MKLIFIFLLSFSSSVFSQSHYYFWSDFKDAFYLKNTKRGEQLQNHIRVTKFSKIGRIFSPDAQATYNDKTNTISLDRELLRKRGRGYELKGAWEILSHDYSGFPKLSTIFHELGHAEIDVFVENEKELTDLLLNKFYQSNLRPLYKKYFKGLKPWIVFHEHFSYYRSELIENLSMDIMDLMLENGFSISSGKCFLTPSLRKKIEEGASLDDFLRLDTSRVKNYHTVAPSYLFVKGKEVNLSLVKGKDLEVLQRAHREFWFYHLEFYGFPRSIKELVDNMDRDSRFDKLRKCRERLYNQFIYASR